MKKSIKLTSAFLTLFTVMSLFAACSNNDNKEENTTDNVTLQAYVDNTEFTEESTTEAETTKAEATTKVKETVTTKQPIKLPNVTKAPSATKAPSTTKAPDTTKAPGTTNAPNTTNPADKPEDNNTTVAPTTNPAVTEEAETLAPNVNLLLGIWDAQFEVENVTFYIQFDFKQDKTVKTDLTKNGYDKMIDGIVANEMSVITQEDIIEAGFASTAEYEEALRAFLSEELPYNELKAGFQTTGTWKLDGNHLTVTIEGETETAETKLLEGERVFVLKDSAGEPMTLTKRG